jgi:hypothetical protein
MDPDCNHIVVKFLSNFPGKIKAFKQILKSSKQKSAVDTFVGRQYSRRAKKGAAPSNS